MNVVDTELADAKIIEPKVFGDQRGFFLESFNKSVYDKAGLPTEFVQDNHSRSAKGVLRGLHFQLKKPQGKLVRVTRGEVFDVAVDLRKSSPDFGRWTGVVLSEENQKLFWVPPGFAHGFYVLSDIADFQYKCTEYYHPEFEHTLQWDDPAVGVQWPIIDGHTPVLSEKDSVCPPLGELEVYT